MFRIKITLILCFVLGTSLINANSIGKYERVIIEEAPKKEIKMRSMKEFLHGIGHRESTNNYNAVNPYGYLGRYQFSLRTLEMLGIETEDTLFLNNPRLQEKAMIRYLRYNRRVLQKYKINEGFMVNSVVITESGLLAAAHLAGAGNVIKFYQNQTTFQDGNGICLTDYLIKFSGYEIHID